MCLSFQGISKIWSISGDRILGRKNNLFFILSTDGNYWHACGSLNSLPMEGGLVQWDLSMDRVHPSEEWEKVRQYAIKHLLSTSESLKYEELDRFTNLEE